jgi:hypothetical protein
LKTNQYKPRYPLYIVSKGRSDSRLTSKALEDMNTPYFIVVEQSEYDDYAAVIDPHKILILPERYKDEYELMDSLGRTQSTGAGPARNFAWDHSIEAGHKRHWVMDDNIKGFHRLHKNRRIRINSGVCFRIMEDFCDRYENVAIAGPQYYMFTPSRWKWKPVVLNVRIYSCNLIQNDLPFRWRCRHNEDTDLSLQALKAGHCTIMFNAFLQHKAVTQSVKGGNTDAFYSTTGDKDMNAHKMYDSTGTIDKSNMLAKVHPEITKVVWKFGRVHHQVDYRAFRHNPLKLKKGIDLKAIPPNDYGIKLRISPKSQFNRPISAE